MPRSPKTSGFVAMALRTLPYVAVLNGASFAALGLYLSLSTSMFSFQSEATQVHLLVVESRKHDNKFVYRPLFETIQDDGTPITYSGSAWVSPKPHNEGDVVDGRVDWDTGEIRSVKMMQFYATMGKSLSTLGGICFVIGVLFLWQKRGRSKVV